LTTELQWYSEELSNTVASYLGSLEEMCLGTRLIHPQTCNSFSQARPISFAHWKLCRESEGGSSRCY